MVGRELENTIRLPLDRISLDLCCEDVGLYRRLLFYASVHYGPQELFHDPHNLFQDPAMAYRECSRYRICVRSLVRVGDTRIAGLCIGWSPSTCYGSHHEGYGGPSLPALHSRDLGTLRSTRYVVAKNIAAPTSSNVFVGTFEQNYMARMEVR